MRAYGNYIMKAVGFNCLFDLMGWSLNFKYLKDTQLTKKVLGWKYTISLCIFLKIIMVILYESEFLLKRLEPTSIHG